MATKTKYETTLTLPSDREILMTRKFDAPREIVWQAITDPELIPRWWGFARDATEVKKMNVRPGGQWQFISTGPRSSSTPSSSGTWSRAKASWRSRSSSRTA